MNFFFTILLQVLFRLFHLTFTLKFDLQTLVLSSNFIWFVDRFTFSNILDFSSSTRFQSSMLIYFLTKSLKITLKNAIIHFDCTEEECNYIFREIPSCKKRLIPKHEIKVSRKKQPSPKKVETVQRFSSKSDHQPSFKVVMRQSNVQGRFNMVSPSCFINPPLNSLFDLLIYFSFVLEVIPYDFAVKYLSEEIGTIKLQTTDCRNWQLLYKWCRTDRATYAYISSGWKHFAEDNRLKEGDIGLFQLVNKHSFSFTKLQNNSLPPEKETAATGNPFFEVNIFSKSYKNSF